MLKMPDGRLKVLVQGLTRARVTKFVATEPFSIANVEILPERDSKEITLEQEAMLRQGAHQGAQKSTSTGSSLLAKNGSKFAVVSVTGWGSRMATWHLPQTGPLSRRPVRTRLTARHLGHTAWMASGMAPSRGIGSRTGPG